MIDTKTDILQEVSEDEFEVIPKSQLFDGISSEGENSQETLL